MATLPVNQERASRWGEAPHETVRRRPSVRSHREILRGTRALKGVSLKVERGEIVALLGENGAGKSTLIKVLGGIHRPDEGGVFIDGTAYAHETGKAGGQKVAFIHQDLGLIEWMSVAENIALALGYVRRGRRIDWTATEAAADAALRLVEAEFPATARVSNLTRTQKSLVPLPARWPPIATFWCWTNPPPAFPRTRSNACSPRCAR